MQRAYYSLFGVVVAGFLPTWGFVLGCNEPKSTWLQPSFKKSRNKDIQASITCQTALGLAIWIAKTEVTELRVWQLHVFSFGAVLSMVSAVEFLVHYFSWWSSSLWPHTWHHYAFLGILLLGGVMMLIGTFFLNISRDVNLFRFVTNFLMTRMRLDFYRIRPNPPAVDLKRLKKLGSKLDDIYSARELLRWLHSTIVDDNPKFQLTLNSVLFHIISTHFANDSSPGDHRSKFCSICGEDNVQSERIFTVLGKIPKTYHQDCLGSQLYEGGDPGIILIQRIFTGFFLRL